VGFVIPAHTNDLAGLGWGQQLDGFERDIRVEPAISAEGVAVDFRDLAFGSGEFS
jgi:hypothetical protein